jgi:uncharacterized damage-inducible protein DinB
MNISFMVRQMADNADRIKALVRGVSDEEARWKLDAASWSILETVNHLYDEEREDFRVRLDIILHRPEEPWPPIDPAGWVLERKYNERDLEESLEGFLAERKSSLKWLRSLGKPDLDATYTSPLGSMSAGDMLTSWVTHDHLHMRQLVELHRFLTEIHSDPYKMEYAGQW